MLIFSSTIDSQVCESILQTWSCEVRPPLWSSGQSSRLQIQMSGFDSRCYQIFWKVVALKWGPLSLVTKIEELLRRKSSVSGLESRECGRRDQSRWPRDTLYPQTLALTSPTSGGRLVGTVRSRNQAMKDFFFMHTFTCSQKPQYNSCSVCGIIRYFQTN
jgi:hypothetical protein